MLSIPTSMRPLSNILFRNYVLRKRRATYTNHNRKSIDTHTHPVTLGSDADAYQMFPKTFRAHFDRQHKRHDDKRTNKNCLRCGKNYTMINVSSRGLFLNTNNILCVRLYRMAYTTITTKRQKKREKLWVSYYLIQLKTVGLVSHTAFYRKSTHAIIMWQRQQQQFTKYGEKIFGFAILQTLTHLLLLLHCRLLPRTMCVCVCVLDVLR